MTAPGGSGSARAGALQTRPRAPRLRDSRRVLDHCGVASPARDPGLGSRTRYAAVSSGVLTASRKGWPPVRAETTSQTLARRATQQPGLAQRGHARADTHPASTPPHRTGPHLPSSAPAPGLTTQLTSKLARSSNLGTEAPFPRLAWTHGSSSSRSRAWLSPDLAAKADPDGHAEQIAHRQPDDHVGPYATLNVGLSSIRPLRRSYMRVVEMLAWPSHSCTMPISAPWSSAFVAAVARRACAPT